MSESEVRRRQILTYKVDPRALRDVFQHWANKGSTSVYITLNKEVLFYLLALNDLVSMRHWRFEIPFV